MLDPRGTDVQEQQVRPGFTFSTDGTRKSSPAVGVVPATNVAAKDMKKTNNSHFGDIVGRFSVRSAGLNILLGLLIGIQAVHAYSFLAPLYFYNDDFLNFAISHENGLTLTYLFRDVFGHFVPFHRLLDFVVAVQTPPNWALASFIQLLFLSGSTFLLYRVVLMLVGRTWWNLVLAFFYGFSIMVVVPLRWWASALHVMPGHFFTLLSVYAFLKYLVTRSKWYFGLVVLGEVIGLLFYEKALLTPIYLFLLAGLFCSSRGSLKHGLYYFTKQWALWIALAAPCIGYLVFYFNNYAARPKLTRPGLLLDFFSVLWLKGFGPAVLGIAFPEMSLGGNEVATMLLAQLVLVLLVVVSLQRRRDAWTAWVLFAIAFVLNAMIVAVGRLSEWGPSLASDYRYFGESAYLFAITVALAFSKSKPNVLKGSPLVVAGRVKVTRSRAVVFITVMLALVGYMITSHYSAKVRRDSWGGIRSRRFTENFLRDFEALRALRGNISLFNSYVPFDSMPPAFFPYNLYSYYLPVLRKGLVFNDARLPNYLLHETGNVAAAELNVRSYWNVTYLQTRGGVVKARADNKFCIQSVDQEATVEVPLIPPLSTGNWFLRMAYETAVPTLVSFEILSTGEYQRGLEHVGQVELSGDRSVFLGNLLPNLAPTAVRVRLEPDRVLCINSIELGAPSIVVAH